MVQVPGIILFLAHLPILIIKKMMHVQFDVADTSLFNGQHIFYITTALTMVIGLFMIAFSKEKIEDEQISQLRLESLKWAICFNYLLLIISLTFTKGYDAIDILRMNLWLPLMVFILLFRWKLYRNNRLIKDDAL
ncbi:hypothetical protein [Mucilaginibacter humi]|nr:hypothetical protein [Mucilaginibacter humi]